VPIQNAAGTNPAVEVWTRYLTSTATDQRNTANAVSYNVSYAINTTVINLTPDLVTEDGVNYSPVLDEQGNPYYYANLLWSVKMGTQPDVVIYFTTVHRILSEIKGEIYHSESWSGYKQDNAPELSRYAGPESYGPTTVSLTGPEAANAITQALQRYTQLTKVPSYIPVAYLITFPQYANYFNNPPGISYTTSVVQLPNTPAIVQIQGLVGSGNWDSIPFESADPLKASLSTPTATSKSLTKMQYRFTLTPLSPAVITWQEIFTPKDTTKPKIYINQTWAHTAEQTESLPYTIDPTGFDPGDANAAQRNASQDGTWEVVLFAPELAVDANRDGTIKLASEDASDATSSAKPYRFWLNDDFDPAISPSSIPNFADDRINGQEDLKKDFFPVFLDIKPLVAAMPPINGYTYKLKQADDALNFIYSTSTRLSAFEDARLSPVLASAPVKHITAAGIELSESFLKDIRDRDYGVIFVEGAAPTTQPLVLTVEKGGVVLLELSLPLSIGQDILLLLHGMNSNTDTWNTFTDAVFPRTGGVAGFSDIRDRAIQDLGFAPARNSRGVRCYRLQFGAFETTATATVGLENLVAKDAKGSIGLELKSYLDEITLKCGDFESFSDLGREVREAVQLLLLRHPNAHIVLLGHSRGGISGRVFLQESGSSPAQKAVVGLLTTSSPHKGSRLARVYKWLEDHPKNAPGTNSDDWEVVDFLRLPTYSWNKDATIDVRRPVIKDVADISQAIRDLNNSSALANLPSGVRYGEIIYDKVDLGTMTLITPRYSVFGGGFGIGQQLSSGAEAFCLGVGNTPSTFPGDGLVPAGNQVFTTLDGFPAPAQGAASNKIERLVVKDREVVHTGAPSETENLLTQLKLLVPEWFP
jgi:hypothetical protein